jgi:hypothetical protein
MGKTHVTIVMGTVEYNVIIVAVMGKMNAALVTVAVK